MPDRSRPVHEQVNAIVAAAEATAERMRLETEQRINDRIAEGERAGELRVEAAEAEAQDIVKWAQEEAARVREETRAKAEEAKTVATTEALTIVSRAQDQADILRAEGEAEKTEATSKALEIIGRAQESAEAAVTEAEEKARQLLGGVRDTTSELQTEGMELVENLRQMGDSLRANSGRLLRDVQQVHKQMVAQIEAAGGDVGGLGPIHASRAGERLSHHPLVEGELDVPEFIPRG